MCVNFCVCNPNPTNVKHYNEIFIATMHFAQSAGAVEYTDCFSAEG